MCPDPVERRLAAILSADAVGYSRLMAEDEAATVRILTDYREEMAVLIRQYRGRVVDAPGDNLLAEFPTATDAVTCAIEIQAVLRARNANLPAERRMDFRIGVHLGDVAVQEGRVYGDGVNIAARLEALAEAGASASRPQCTSRCGTSSTWTSPTSATRPSSGLERRDEAQAAVRELLRSNPARHSCSMTQPPLSLRVFKAGASYPPKSVSVST